MGGQQSESAYARIDYVDGKFREHDKKHKADMDGVKVSFEQAAEKYNELKEQVIGLKAVVESLQTIIRGNIGVVPANNCKEEIKSENCVSVKELYALIRKYHYIVKWGSSEICKAFLLKGYVKAIYKPDGKLNNYVPTSKGVLTGLITDSPSRCAVLFNTDRLDEIVSIVDEYHAAFEKTMNQIMGVRE